MLHACGVLTAADRAAIRDALREIGAAHARGEWRVTLELEDGQTALETRLSREAGRDRRPSARGPVAQRPGARGAAPLSARRRRRTWREAPRASPQALDGLSERQGTIALPGYTHMQQAMPSSVALWAGGFAAEIRDDAEGLRRTMRRIDKNPLGSAAGYGTPNLPVDREITRAALGFAENHEPVTAVQLSRGKAEAGVLFEIALLMQDLGRLASDVLLFYTREFGFVALPEEFTTGSSIMPQKRNPDVFELVRGPHGDARRPALSEVLAITAKLPSGYQRDLQLIKAPLFRSIDLCHAVARHHGRRDRTVSSSYRSASGSTRTSTPPRRRTRWSWPKGFRSARPTGASRRAVAEPTRRPAELTRCRYRVLQARASGRAILSAWVGGMHCALLQHSSRRCRSRSSLTPFP